MIFKSLKSKKIFLSKNLSFLNFRDEVHKIINLNLEIEDSYRVCPYMFLELVKIVEIKVFVQREFYR
jgi:hypothetical protein